MPAIAITLLLAVCGPDAPPPPPTRVGVESVRPSEFAPLVMLTGDVEARVTSDLSFKIAGRIQDRKAEVGEHVTAGQILATLDTQVQQADVTSAQADVDSADAKIRQSASAFERQKALIVQGFTTRREYDQAEATLRTAQASLEAAKAQLATVQDQLNQTVLRAGAPGVLTARRAEAGEVVQSGQTIYSLAEDGPRDAVFNAYESIFSHDLPDSTIKVTLISDQKIQRPARLREISPVVDRSTGTIRVKLEIEDAPPEMTLGAPVTGLGGFGPHRVTMLPWRALSSDGGKFAVWVVDPASKKVSLQRIEVEAYDKGDLVITSGLQPGQIVVTRGQQLLREGEVVEPVQGVHG